MVTSIREWLTHGVNQQGSLLMWPSVGDGKKLVQHPLTKPRSEPKSKPRQAKAEANQAIAQVRAQAGRPKLEPKPIEALQAEAQVWAKSGRPKLEPKPELVKPYRAQVGAQLKPIKPKPEPKLWYRGTQDYWKLQVIQKRMPVSRDQHHVLSLDFVRRLSWRLKCLGSRYSSFFCCSKKPAQGVFPHNIK